MYRTAGLLTSALTGAAMLVSGAQAAEIVSTPGYANRIDSSLKGSCNLIIDAECMAKTLDEVNSVVSSYDQFLSATTHPRKEDAHATLSNCRGYIDSAEQVIRNADARKAFAYALDAYVSCIYEIEDSGKVINVQYEPEALELLDRHVQCMRGYESCPVGERFERPMLTQ